MRDALLEEIRRVRKVLLRKYGGWEGYERRIRKREVEHRRLERRRTSRSDSMWAAEAAKTPIIRDPILEEIWRVRAELLQKHGGWEGYDRYLQKLEADDRRHERRRKSAAKAHRIKQQKVKAKSTSGTKHKSVA